LVKQAENTANNEKGVVFAPTIASVLHFFILVKLMDSYSNVDPCREIKVMSTASSGGAW
jgi:hypothetical protein